MELPIEEYFKYHPPQTDERKKKHETINEHSLKLASLINDVVKDSECKRMAIFAVQQARMFANQGITVDELKEQQK